MRRQYAIDRLKAAGYELKFLGRNIEAVKMYKIYKGAPTSISIEVFNYKIY